MSTERGKSFNYAIGMFGTSIPINMLKTYAAIYYVDKLGLTTAQFALHAADLHLHRCHRQPGLRLPLRPHAHPLGAPAALAGDRHAAAGAGLHRLLQPASISWPAIPCSPTAMLFYILTGTLDSVINANYGALFPELFRDDASRAKTNALRQAFQLVAMIISIALTPMVTKALGYSLTAILYGILGGAVILYMTFTCQGSKVQTDEEKPQAVEQPQGPAHQPQILDRRAWPTPFTARPCRWCWPPCLSLSSTPWASPTARPPSCSPRCCSSPSAAWRSGPGWCEVHADAGLAGGAGHAGGRLHPALLCQFAGHGHHLQRPGGLRLCRGDHHHGPDRRQDHGRGHRKSTTCGARGSSPTRWAS